MDVMKVFRIWMTANEHDYRDYEAANFSDAFSQYLKETHKFTCWRVHVLTDSELEEWKRQRLMY